MRKLRTFIIAAAVLLCCTAAYADHYSDLYVVPIAGHTRGQNGTNWMSDVAIQNFQNAPLTVQFVVIESGASTDNVYPLTTEENSGSVIVPVGGSVLLTDVLNGHRGAASTTGALLIGGNHPFALTSRTYSQSPAGNTVGQTVPGAADFLDNTIEPIDLSTATAYLPGLVQNASYRTNLGFVAANGSGSSEGMTLSITLRGASGATLGTRSVSVAPGEVVQMQFSARTIAEESFDIGSAELRITSGTGSVVPYASVIDNQTADAAFISGAFPQNDSSLLGKSAAPPPCSAPSWSASASSSSKGAHHLASRNPLPLRWERARCFT
jgi:hypothetical protein